MHTHSVDEWKHSHRFSDTQTQKAEKRTLIVMILTIVTMVAEIAAGLAFGSVALLADGLHMGSHATALGINVFAYIYARKNAGNPDFVFGTGKVNALGGYTGAILLAIFAAGMVWEGFSHLVHPVDISFNWAIGVAVIGLVVNGVSVLLLGVDEHDHGHGHSHSHAHTHNHSHSDCEEHKDLNLRSAYLHVMADALTSVLAIAALLAGKYFGAVWLDPLMGFVGAALILSWSFGLIKETSSRLLDRQAPQEVREAVASHIEADTDNRIYDLHIWLIAPNAYAAIIGIVTHNPQKPEHYKALIPDTLNIKHITIETERCDGPD